VSLGSLELSDEERETVRGFNARFAGRKRQITAETLFDGWSSLVAKLERGYAGGVDDYANDLRGRDLLDELAHSSPASLRIKLEAVLEPLDERFRSATVADDGKALSQYFNLSEGWWWRRAPRQGQLATYLRDGAN
jgi:hypothetical protein